MAEGAVGVGSCFAALALCEGSCGSASVTMSVVSCSSDLASVGSSCGCRCFGGCDGCLLGSVSPGGGAIKSWSFVNLSLSNKSCGDSEGCLAVSRSFCRLSGNTV